MKQLIAPIAIIIALVAFFFIIDRKEFSRHDGVQTVQSESPTSNRKPTVSVPETKPITEVKPTVETKPVAETKPVTEAKPVAESKPKTDPKPAETKPVAETKPAEAKPAETKPVAETRTDKPAETKPVAQTKPEEKLLPAAVPVVTAEEAEKLNQYAIKNFEMFDRKKDKTILEGKIVEISQCPDPTTLDYPDCNLSAIVLLNDIAQTEICIIIPCIRDSKIVLPDTIKTNTLISFKIRDEDSLSEKEKSIQLVDDNPNYSLDYCYSDCTTTIAEYSKITEYEKKGIDEIVYDKNIVLTDSDKVIRQEYISKEIDRLNMIISDFSPEDALVFSTGFSKFDKDIDTNLPYAELEYDDGSKKIFPVQINYSVKDYLNSALSNNVDLMVHNAQVIASVNNYLKERGILLLVVPVPQPYESYAQLFHLSQKLSTYNINRILFMRQLLKLGVEVLDLEPMIEEDIMLPFHYFLLFRKDCHPSEIGAYHIAQKIYNHLEKYSFSNSLIKNDYSIELKPIKEVITYHGERFKDMDSLQIEKVESPINKQSPFLLVGDSFTYTSHFQYYLSYFLKTKINMIGRGSSFPDTAQLLQMRSSEISPNTKVCILVNSSYHLYRKFNYFLETGIQLYPSTSFHDLNLTMNSCEIHENPFSFDLPLPDVFNDFSRYKLLVFTYSNDNKVRHSISINSQQPKQVRNDYSSVEFPLSEHPNSLHFQCSASFQDGYEGKKDSTLTITKIFLIEE